MHLLFTLAQTPLHSYPNRDGRTVGVAALKISPVVGLILSDYGLITLEWSLRDQRWSSSNEANAVVCTGGVRGQYIPGIAHKIRDGQT